MLINQSQNLNQNQNHPQGFQNNQVAYGQQANGNHYNNTSNDMGVSQGGVMPNNGNMVNTLYGTGRDAKRLDAPNDMVVSNHEHI